MTIIKRANVILISIIILLLASSVGTFGATKVKVGVHETKPLSFTAEDGSLSGIYPDVLKEIARLSGWEIEWKKVTWTEGLKMAQKGEIDLLGPIAFTKERLQNFRFNQEAVFIDWGQVYLSKNSKIKTVLDLEGKTIVFQQNHIMGKTLDDLLKRFDIDYIRVPVKDQKKVFEIIANGEADAGVVNRLFGRMNEKEYDIQKSPIIYSPIELRFATPKTVNNKILKQLDTTLKKIKTDKGSPYHKILDKWLFGKLDSIQLLNLKQIFLAAGVGFIIGLIMLLWMISLKSQVKSRTKELAEKKHQLEDANLLLNAVMENTTDAVFIKNLDGKYILANESTCKAIGKPLENVIGKTDAQLFPSDSADIINTIDALVIDKGNPQLSEEKLHTAYGESYWLSNKSPYFDEKKNIIGIIGISRNITELKNAQREKGKLQSQLRQAHKMEAIGTLAGGIAHDFNNILGIIIGNLELALDDIPKWNPALKNIEEIKVASFRARDVVRQLLSFSRKTEQSQEPIAINDIIKESMSLLRASTPTTIEINTNLPQKSEMILADATQIHQVMINLCTNATHAMEEKGGFLSVEVINIHLTDETTFDLGELSRGDYVQITVQDTGTGIDSATQKKIFDPYYTSKETGKGTGMGLAVVQGIILNHKGAISVHSEINKGTSIKVLFPISDQQKIINSTVSEELPIGHERILFIDDEPSLAKLGKQMIERLGYKVETVTDPEKAFDIFASNPYRFDLIITDLAMPKLTGVNLSKKILAVRPEIPIILCTGFSDKIDSKTVTGIGIKKLLEKPLSKQKFATIIRDVLDKT